MRHSRPAPPGRTVQRGLAGPHASALRARLVLGADGGVSYR